MSKSIILACFVLFFPLQPLASPMESKVLEGYLRAVVERELNIENYELTVSDTKKITLLIKDAKKQDILWIKNYLAQIDDINEIIVEKTTPIKRNQKNKLKPKLFPKDDLFQPLVADPKQTKFSASIRAYDYGDDNTTVAAIGFGESFNFYQWQNLPIDGSKVNLGIEAGVFAHFDMETESKNLINADYMIGIPLTYRKDNFSSKLRVYHQSAHLGDEFLLENKVNRINYSFESLHLLSAYDLDHWRFYGGGEYQFHIEPDNFDPVVLQGGIEYYGDSKIMSNGRFIAGLDLKAFEEHSYFINQSLKFGLEFGNPSPAERNLRLMLEAYNGYSPHGQFYNNKIKYFGVGFEWGF